MIVDTPVRKILVSKLHTEASCTGRSNRSAEVVDVKLPNTPNNRLVCTCSPKTEASGLEYAESFKEYALKYKKKASKLL